MWEDEQFFKALKTVGPNFEKIAEMIGTRSKSQVRAFHNAEVKKINAVLAPLGVQVDPLDHEEVHTAMESWHSMKDRLSVSAGGLGGKLGKRDTERNRLAWEFKNELDKSVWTEGKKRAKLKALGVLGADSEVEPVADAGVIGLMKASPTVVKTKGASVRGRPKGSKNDPMRKKAQSPGRKTKGKKSESADGNDASAKQTKTASGKSSKSGTKHGDESGKARLMLQLFAVDEVTKSALQAAGLNPHLELTFRAKKSVPGLMQHLAVKWAAAIDHLPKSIKEQHPTLQLYPFEAASADDAAGAWNESHDGATATDIFDACGRPAMFRVRYGWVAHKKAAARPHLAPPPPPVHQQSVAHCPRSRSGTPPENVSPRKRAAEEMHVSHVTSGTDSFCHEPVQGGAFGGIFGGGTQNGGSTQSHQFANQFGFGFGSGSIFGADLAGAALFGEPNATSVPPGSGLNQNGTLTPSGTETGVRNGTGVTATPVPNSGEFTLTGFVADGEFSNMCREMGLEDPSLAGRPAPAGSKPKNDGSTDLNTAKPIALTSAAPSVVTDRARRTVISEFDANGALGNNIVTVGGILENDMFSLTQMLGDVPDDQGKTKDGVGSGAVAKESGPSSFAGMFSGNLEDAMGAKPGSV